MSRVLFLNSVDNNWEYSPADNTSGWMDGWIDRSFVLPCMHALTLTVAHRRCGDINLPRGLYQPLLVLHTTLTRVQCVLTSIVINASGDMWAHVIMCRRCTYASILRGKARD